LKLLLFEVAIRFPRGMVSIRINYSGCFMYSMLPSTLTLSLKGKKCSSVEKLFLFIKDEKGNKLYHLIIYCTITWWHFVNIYIF